MKKILLIILASTFSLSAAQASTGVAYKVDCLVYGSDTRISARKEGAVVSGDSFVVHKQAGVQYVAGVEEGVMPNNQIFRQMNLVILKKGKVIARAMAEFDPVKESYAIVSAEASIGSLSCVQKQ